MSLVNKMRNMNLGVYKDRFQGVLAMNAAQPFYTAGFHNTGGSSPTLYPFYVLQLDTHPGMPQMAPVPTGSVINRLGYNGSSAQLVWFTQNGAAAQANTNAPVYGYSNYFNSISLKGDTVFTVLGQAMSTQTVLTLKDIMINLLVRAPTSRPMFCKIQLVHLDEDYQVALSSAVQSTAGSGGTSISGDEKGLWERQIKPYLYNPLVKDAPSVGSKKIFKVVKTWTIKTQPDSSTNKDTIGLQKKLTLKLNINSIRNFLAAQPTTVIGDLDTSQANFQGRGNSTLTAIHPVPERRFYLTMRFTSYDDSVTAFDPTLHASFDIVVDRTWVVDPSS